MSELGDYIMTLTLVDHHCHGLVTRELDRPDFEQLATESDRPAPAPTTGFDSPLGVFIRAECAPLLGLPRHCGADDYIQQRALLGSETVAERLLQHAGIGDFIIDTGFQSDLITSPAQVARAARGRAHQIARLETLAETVGPGASAADFLRSVRDAIHAAAQDSVGFKSIIAYRFGLDFDPLPPTPHEVLDASAQWLASCEASGTWRLDHPVLMRHLLWEAVPLGLPIQFHVGYGDSDITLHRCDPSHLTGFLRATADSGTNIMLLHCCPFIRTAGILAQVFPHVFLDTGLGMSHAGSGAVSLARESLEVAPFGKVLFSSDAFGLPELYLAGSLLWRRALGEVLGDRVARDEMSLADACRYAEWIGAGNARRTYRLEESS